MSQFVIDDAMWGKLEQPLPLPKGRHGENDRLFIEAGVVLAQKFMQKLILLDFL